MSNVHEDPGEGDFNLNDDWEGLTPDDEAEDIAAQLDGEPSVRDLLIQVLTEIADLRHRVDGILRGNNSSFHPPFQGGGTSAPFVPPNYVSPNYTWTDNTNTAYIPARDDMTPFTPPRKPKRIRGRKIVNQA